MRPREILSAVESGEILDRPAAAIAEVAHSAWGRRAGSVLRGAWLGHPVHPILVTVPIGAWSCSALFDLLPGNAVAARRLVAIGLAAVPLAAAAGAADFPELGPRQRRVGVAHLAGNLVATGLFAGSYLARRRDARVSGRVLGLLGLAVAGAGGALGGHLSYAQGAGVFRFTPGKESTVD